MDDIVRVDVARTRATIARRKVFEKLDARAGVRAYSGDVKTRPENLIQMFLLRPKVFALAGFAKSE